MGSEWSSLSERKQGMCRTERIDSEIRLGALPVFGGACQTLDLPVSVVENLTISFKGALDPESKCECTMNGEIHR